MLPPLNAYRSDRARRAADAPFGPVDADWITLATLTRQLATLGEADAVAADGYLRAIHAILRALVGPEWRRTRTDVPMTAPSWQTTLRTVAEDIEDAGAIALSDALLGAQQRVPGVDAIECGRLIAQRARLAWKAGDHATADERYDCVAAMGDSLGSAELSVRADIGKAVLARLRGNVPETRRFATRAVECARINGFDGLGALGHHCLMVADAGAGNFDSAVKHAWLAYQDVTGDAMAQAEALADLAQLFLEQHMLVPAVDGFRAALAQRLSVRSRLLALGGLASALGRRHDLTGVQATVRTIEEITQADLVPYSGAHALAEAAGALAECGLLRDAERLAQTALSMCTTYGFHELQFRVEETLARTASALPAVEVRATSTARFPSATPAWHPDANTDFVVRSVRELALSLR